MRTLAVRWQSSNSKKRRDADYAYTLKGRPSTHTHISTTHAMKREHLLCLLPVCNNLVVLQGQQQPKCHQICQSLRIVCQIQGYFSIFPNMRPKNQPFMIDGNQAPTPFPTPTGIKNNTQTLQGAHLISQEGEATFSHSGGFSNAWVLKTIPNRQKGALFRSIGAPPQRAGIKNNTRQKQAIVI